MQKTYKSAGTFTRRIGNTCYRVIVHCCPDENEGFADKVIRMIQNDIDSLAESLNSSFPNGSGCGMINQPQTSRAA